MPGDRIVCLALGTRGDVGPVASVAAWLAADLVPPDRRGAAAPAAAAVTLITHAAHQAWLQELPGVAHGRLQLQCVASLPAAVWRTEEHAGSHEQAPVADEAAVRSQLLQHCVPALALQWPPSPHQHQQHQQQQPRRVLCFNLFALEGYHIAEALQVPCCVLQPYLMPYSCPASFRARFEKAEPRLAAALQAAAAPEPRLAAAEAASGKEACTPAVSWSDVHHWMWPLFSERWGAWRQEQLGLHPWPLVEAVAAGWQGCTFAGAVAAAAAADGSSSTSADPPPAAAAAAADRACPRAVPVLLGLSPHVTPRPGFWPPAVQQCGLWLTSELHAQLQPGLCRLPPALHAFLQAAEPAPAPPAAPAPPPAASLEPAVASKQQQQRCILVVDFGSMGALGLIPDAGALLAVLLAALQRLGPAWRCVLLTGGWAALAAAHEQLLEQQQQLLQQQPGPPGGDQVAGGASSTTPDPALLSRLHVQRSSVACHHLLLEEAATVLLHHGGSGTVGTSLAAGTPQVVLPLQFDQGQTAEQIAHLGCCPPPLDARTLLPPASACQASVDAAAVALAAHALAAHAPAIRQACRHVQGWLAGERGGLATAAGLIVHHLDAVFGAPSCCADAAVK